jgi:hypothetical protein
MFSLVKTPFRYVVSVVCNNNFKKFKHFELQYIFLAPTALKCSIHHIDPSLSIKFKNNMFGPESIRKVFLKLYQVLSK